MGELALNMSEESVEHHIVTLFEKLETLRRDGRGDGGDGGGGRVPAARELRSAELWRAVAAEGTASFLYVLVVCGAAAGAGVGASASALLLASAIAAGAAAATVTLCFAHISGGHISPAVTAAQCVRRRVSPLRAALYVTAQCAGAVAAAAMLHGTGAGGAGGGGVAASLPARGEAAWSRLATELVVSALVVAAHAQAAARRWAGAAPALLGAAYCACTLVSMSYLNPARLLGPSFVLNRWESHWVYWVGPVSGAVGCALVQEWCSRRRGSPPSSSGGSEGGDYDDVGGKGGASVFPPPHRAASTYCSAPAPDRGESLYSGTKSLYCRSPPPARHTLHRSQSVYSKGSGGAGAGGAGGAGPLLAAHSLLLRPHAHAHTHAAHTHTHAAHAQNAHNAHRDAPYSAAAAGPRPGPAGAAMQERRESVYGTASRRPTLSHQSDDSAYGSYTRAPLPAAGVTATYRVPHAPHAPPDHHY